MRAGVSCNISPREARFSNPPPDNYCTVLLGLLYDRRKRFEIHLITKISDMKRRFEVILKSFSSDECNGQFKFKIK